MRFFVAMFFVVVSLVVFLFFPVYAQSSDKDIILIQGEDVTTFTGSVVEKTPLNRDYQRRKSLSSRGRVIVQTATRYLGTPYRWAGTAASGFDCSGFVMKVFNLNGVTIRRMADEQYYAGNKINKEELNIGDLVFFSTYGPGVTHVGIYTGNNQFIHSSSRKGVTISSMNDAYYKSRYIGGCRY